MIQPQPDGGRITEHRSGSEPGQSAPVVEVPERPALSQNVQLVGEMPETGFTDRQWLVQRDGRWYVERLGLGPVPTGKEMK